MESTVGQAVLGGKDPMADPPCPESYLRFCSVTIWQKRASVIGTREQWWKAVVCIDSQIWAMDGVEGGIGKEVLKEVLKDAKGIVEALGWKEKLVFWELAKIRQQ